MSPWTTIIKCKKRYREVTSGKAELITKSSPRCINPSHFCSGTGESLVKRTSLETNIKQKGYMKEEKEEKRMAKQHIEQVLLTNVQPLNNNKNSGNYETNEVGQCSLYILEQNSKWKKRSFF